MERVLERRTALKDALKASFTAAIAAPLLPQPADHDLSGEDNDDAQVIMQVQSTRERSFFGWMLAVTADMLRAVHLSVLFAPVGISTLLAWLFPNNFFISMRDSSILWVLEAAGPTFIKLGQWASTRPDLLPMSLCDTLSRLHANVLPLSFPVVQAELERVYGAPVDTIFSSMDHAPIGSGCIAQVHRGRLRSSNGDDGLEVAIKVQRPGIVDAFRRDLRLFSRCASALRVLLPSSQWFSVEESMLEFSMFMFSQLDFRREASRLHRFIGNFKGVPHVKFPVPQDSLCRRRVLVETYERGVPVLKLASASKEECSHLARVGLRAFLQMIFVDNFSHADMHPGNMLVRRSETGKPELVILDAGLVTELSPEDRVNFLDLFAAVAAGKGRLAGKLIVQRTKVKPGAQTDEFVDGVDQLVSVVRDKRFTLRGVDVSDILMNMLVHSRKCQVKLDAAFTRLLVGIVTIEGLGRQLDPDVDIFRESLPMLRRAAPALTAAVLRQVFPSLTWRNKTE